MRKLGVMGLAVASPAVAQLDGQALTAEWHYPEFGRAYQSFDVVVGPGVELDHHDSPLLKAFEIDIADDSVTFVFTDFAGPWQEVAFNGWAFHDVEGTIPEVVGYEVIELSPGIGNTDEIVTGFDADAFWADFGGVTVGSEDYIVLGVEFASACPADLNGDGALNILDFVAFQLLWSGMDPAADCDGSGTFTILDFICFQAEFQEGCP